MPLSIELTGKTKTIQDNLFPNTLVAGRNDKTWVYVLIIQGTKTKEERVGIDECRLTTGTDVKRRGVLPVNHISVEIHDSMPHSKVAPPAQAVRKRARRL